MQKQPIAPTHPAKADESSHTRHGFRRQRHVLVVDDDAEVLSSICELLEGTGYHVTAFERATQAIEALSEASFHLVVTDLYLGKELGYAVAECARGCNPPVPTIVLTGRPSLAGAQEAIRSSVSDFVVKPVDPMTLASACHRAIRQAEADELNRRLEAQNRVLAQVLPRAIEAKDPTTSGHAERVVTYTDNLAQRCGVADEERGDLRLASLLHDVGKIGISERILTKAGPLDPEERLEIQKHPEFGHAILEPLVGGERVRRWVYQHHERWDGKGYPNGLHKDDVELPGRILILAEVYDALAEVRSYKPAWETEKIVELFRREAGAHFDPDLAHLVADGLEQSGPRFFERAPDQLF